MTSMGQVDSIRLDKIHRGKVKIQPFFYSFINRDDTFNDGGANPTNKPRYIPMASNETKIIPIALQDDGIFRLHNLQFNVADTNNELGQNLGYTAPFPPVGSVLQTAHYQNSVEIELFVESNGARQLIEFGSSRLFFGNQGGMKFVRRPFLLPRSGLISVRIKNKLPFAIRIDGYLFGYKVQL